MRFSPAQHSPARFRFFCFTCDGLNCSHARIHTPSAQGSDDSCQAVAPQVAARLPHPQHLSQLPQGPQHPAAATAWRPPGGGASSIRQNAVADTLPEPNPHSNPAMRSNPVSLAASAGDDGLLGSSRSSSSFRSRHVPLRPPLLPSLEVQSDNSRPGSPGASSRSSPSGSHISHVSNRSLPGSELIPGPYQPSTSPLAPRSSIPLLSEDLRSVDAVVMMDLAVKTADDTGSHSGSPQPANFGRRHQRLSNLMEPSRHFMPSICSEMVDNGLHKTATEPDEATAAVSRGSVRSPRPLSPAGVPSSGIEVARAHRLHSLDPAASVFRRRRSLWDPREDALLLSSSSSQVSFV